MNNVNEILESIYKAYGTDSGILFGIREKDIVKAIIEFTINRITPETPSEEWISEDYWKKRCEAAEKIIHMNDVFANEPEWKAWEELKQSIPIPKEESQDEKLLLDFCHFLGRRGYKINGYDDGQLITIINQFRKG